MPSIVRICNPSKGWSERLRLVSPAGLCRIEVQTEQTPVTKLERISHIITAGGMDLYDDIL